MLRNAKSEKRSAKCEKSDVKYPAIYFSFFAFRDRFRVFCDKCIASLKNYMLMRKLTIAVISTAVSKDEQ